MRDALLLLKATRSLNDRTSIVTRKFFFGMLMFLMIIDIFLIVIVDGKDSSTIVINFANILNISTIYAFVYGQLLRTIRGNLKNDFLQFAIQFPVSKRALSVSRFIHIWITFMPILIILITQNISCYAKSLEGMAGYIGLCTILSCFQFIILSFISGFNPFVETNSHTSKVLQFLLLAILILPVVIMFSTIGLKNEEIYYGMFGPSFVGVFERLEFFSGMTGGLIVIISIALGYLLSFTIPNKIFGKKGWNV